MLHSYWDWALDWPDIAESPIWDDIDDFGGNDNATAGDASDIDPDFTGYCVDDGPFAGLEVLHVGADYKPHCLARNFQNITNSQKAHHYLQPEALKKLLEEADYESFNLKVDDGPHLAIPLQKKKYCTIDVSINIMQISARQ